jgi:alcohol dehydrogenase
MKTRPAQSVPAPADGGVLARFDHQPRTRLVFGPGTVERTGELARQLGLKTVLLVTDAGVVGAGHAEKVRKSLEAASVKVILFDKVRENPSTRDVADCLDTARAAGVDSFVGLGGGSSMDTAKGCNFLLTNGGRMQDYWGEGKATKPMLPLIAIPTTAGTGSECQSFALIADETTHQKMACGDAKAAARIAILDPAITLTQPLRVAACTGMDALSHALETAVTKRRNGISQTYSREAFRLCWDNFPKVLRTPTNLDARSGMLLGAALAGLAIENSMLGAAHAAANPLSAHYNIVHGQAIGLMLPHVLRFNGGDPSVALLYDSLDCSDANQLAKKLEALRKLAGMPGTLSECGVKRPRIPTLAREAARQWTAAFNPRKVAAADFVRLFEAAWK